MNLQVGQEVTYANGEKGRVISVTAKSPNSVVSQCELGHVYFHNEEGAGIVPDRNIIPPFREGDAVWLSNSGCAWFGSIYCKQEGQEYVDVNREKYKLCKKYVVGEKP